MRATQKLAVGVGAGLVLSLAILAFSRTAPLWLVLGAFAIPASLGVACFHEHREASKDRRARRAEPLAFSDTQGGRAE